MMSRFIVVFCAASVVFSLTAVADAAAIDPADLLAYYNFNGGTADSSGNGPAATLVNGAVLSAAGSGVFGGGADQALDVSGGAALLPVGTHFDSAFTKRYTGGVFLAEAFRQCQLKCVLGCLA